MIDSRINFTLIVEKQDFTWSPSQFQKAIYGELRRLKDKFSARVKLFMYWVFNDFIAF